MKLFKLTRLRILLYCFVMTAAASSSDFSYTGPELILDYSGPVIVDNSHYKYTASDRLTFITEDYLTQNIPKLLPLREAIDTWASMQAVHPKLLSEIMKAYFKDKPVDDSFENKQNVFQIATGLSEGYNQNKGGDLATSKAINAIANAYQFNLDFTDGFSNKRVIEQHPYLKQGGGPPLYTYFQPPWPYSESWAGGGVHTFTGGGNAPRNSLDFFKTFVPWGGNTSNIWVSASQAGMVRVFSECNINVIHTNGWVSTYYHLENIVVNDMQVVSINQKMSNYADDLATATCQGGSSTGPHVHFGIYFDDDPIEIDEQNVDFTSWKHHAGEGNYDSDCKTSYYTMVPGNIIVCPFVRQLPNNIVDFIFDNGFEL